MPHVIGKKTIKLLKACWSLTSVAFLCACGGVSDGSSSSVSPGLKVTPEQIVLSENGGDPGVLTVLLNTAPDNDVVINLANNDPTEATLSKETLTFTSENWSTAQTVVVSAEDDEDVDGTQSFDIAMEVDTEATADTTGYARMQTLQVPVTVTDDEVPGVTISPDPLSGDPIIFSENPEIGKGRFDVVLNTPPSNQVVLSLNSSNTEVATLDNNLSALTFTSQNWATAQSVSVSGVDNHIIDGEKSVDITLAVDAEQTVDDTGYLALPPLTVPLTVTDDDQAGVTVKPASTISFSEGGTGSFTLVLNTIPDGNVEILALSSAPEVAVVDKPTLSFSPDTWNTSQKATVSVEEGLIVGGDQTFTIAVFVDDENTQDQTGYKAVDSAEAPSGVVTVSVKDIAPGLRVDKPVLEPFSETASGVFNVVLDSKPDAKVVIDVVSRSTDVATVEPTQLTFTTENYFMRQMVTVAGVDDAPAVGDRNVEIQLDVNANTEDNTGYKQLASPAAVVTVTVLNDD